MLIWYFREGLQTSVRVEIKQCSEKLDSFKELVEKTVDAEAKAALWPHSYAHKTNQYYLKGSQPSAAKTNSQSEPMKNPRVKKPKLRSQKSKASASECSNSTNTSEQAQKKKKKKDKQHWGQKP